MKKKWFKLKFAIANLLFFIFGLNNLLGGKPRFYVPDRIEFTRFET